jgi:UDP-N-acetyl-D-mannosaminuronic acid dehydrogenase
MFRHFLARDDMRVAIIGLGYVGLTLGVALARRGVEIVGVERRPDVVKLTNEGMPHFSEVGLESALKAAIEAGLISAKVSLEGVTRCDYYIITVGTPLHPETHLPRLDMIEAATRQVADHFEDGATVILRSTVQIGTTTDVVKPILDATGKTYHLAMCPERTLEGDALRELSSLPQIIGGMTPEAGDRAAALFSRLTHTVVRVSDSQTAEMIKLIDNTSRDVRFAFANEVARACDAIGINANEVIEFGKLGYVRTNVAKPGLVGGPCLEKDPHILMTSLKRYGTALEITAASRLVNERQPGETVATMMKLLEDAGRKAPLVVTVAGVAFKGIPETDDLRGSMSLKVIEQLQATGKVKEIRAYDKVASRAELEKLPYGLKVYDDLGQSLEGADLVVIGNNHPVFSKISIDTYRSYLPPHGIIYDYWNNLEHEPAEKLRGRYFTVGNAKNRAAK